MNKRIVGFDAVAHRSAQILILGSMPGEASLQAAQYYAHPRNAFWKIMGELIGLDPNSPYEMRLQALKDAGIALWDVLHACHRTGSLDTAIESDSMEVNHFDTFFEQHPHIHVVCFNGAAAERCYKKYVMLKGPLPVMQYVRLPSTSPAHATLSYAQKVAVWRAGMGAATAMPAAIRPALP
jgi:hypoxanthine-DNA glycosylase